MKQPITFMNKWLEQWMSQPSVAKGDPTRRLIRDVHYHCKDEGEELIRIATAKGYHVVRTDKHYVLLLTGEIKIVC